MQCRSCGSQLPNGATVCPVCGAPQTTGAAAPKKSRLFLVILICGILAVALVVLGILIGSGKLFSAADKDAAATPPAETQETKTPDAEAQSISIPDSPGDTDVSGIVTDAADAGAPWKSLTDSTYNVSIRRLNAYNGVFFEDGSDDEVENVLALQFRNDSDQAIQYAEYVFSVNGTDVVFKFTDIPARAKCVVLEEYRHPYDADEVLTPKSRLVTYTDDLMAADDDITIVENGDDTITVLNTSGRDLPIVRVFYKTYYDEQETYVGGVTYYFEISDLQAGQKAEHYPSTHYSSEFSVFVGSGVYDS